VIRRVNYRFFDSCGQYSHSDEWAECVNNSDAALVIIDGNTVNGAFAFTLEFLKAIGGILTAANRATYFLVNQFNPSEDLHVFTDALHDIFPTISYKYSTIRVFSEEVYDAFDWFESLPVKKQVSECHYCLGLSV
jgi:hypothetical protein